MFNINGVVWRVVIVSPNNPALIKPDGSRAIGCCDRWEHTIYISAAAAYSPLYRQVLYHEVAHAAIASYGIELPVEEEEFLASFLSVYGDEILAVVNQFA